MGRLDQGFDITAFDADTRQTKRSVGSIPYLTGSGIPFPIPKTGFLSKIWLMADITQVTALGGGTAVVDPILGIYGAFNRIVTALSGSKTIYNLTGRGAAMVSSIWGDGFVPEESGLAVAPAHSALVYAAGVVSGVWRIPVLIPVTPNDLEMIGGFLNMYEAVQATVTCTFPPALYSLVPGQAPILTTGAATVVASSGQVNVAMESYEIPRGDGAKPPVNFLHILTEDTKAIGAVGDMTIDHPISNLYLQILHQVVHNGASNTMFVDNHKVVGQRSRLWYDLTQQAFLTDARWRNKRDMREGVLVSDFFYQGETNQGGWRDVIDGRSVTEFQSIITINGAATLGANPFVRTIRRQLEPILTDM